MDLIKRKIFMLLILLAVLIGLLILWLGSSGAVMREAEVVEKYYSPNGSGKVRGITSNEVAEVNASGSSPTCAMKFSNDRILILDCDKYLDYQIGDKVEISYRRGEITEIRGRD
ncbi:hypothetical protein [Bacillus sp. CECT 9360]|uniref:hypothetical protein n=1 Tax=Bacillus sp. CECT 9360 TaxID=2845821 RepID=UPI001E5D5845|nr:hypothetical protein [Bacillus sp. CECT 9360]CAH0347454.1 hypothetical protein BCI9360_03853 [Bacillus sp. CECT 9360]